MFPLKSERSSSGLLEFASVAQAVLAIMKCNHTAIESKGERGWPCLQPEMKRAGIFELNHSESCKNYFAAIFWGQGTSIYPWDLILVGTVITLPKKSLLIHFSIILGNFRTLFLNFPVILGEIFIFGLKIQNFPAAHLHI